MVEQEPVVRPRPEASPLLLPRPQTQVRVVEAHRDRSAFITTWRSLPDLAAPRPPPHSLLLRCCSWRRHIYRDAQDRCLLDGDTLMATVLLPRPVLHGLCLVSAARPASPDPTVGRRSVQRRSDRLAKPTSPLDPFSRLSSLLPPHLPEPQRFCPAVPVRRLADSRTLSASP